MKGGVKFEVDRFGVGADDRLEVAGRWFGVRGRRFLRPTLEFEAEGERQRALAVLDHKPWTAEDGEEWVAAFDWDEAAAPEAAELAVSTDLTVTLGDDVAEVQIDPEAEQRAAEKAALGRARSDLEATRTELEAARALATERDLQTERLRDELARISGERDDLRAELDSATARSKGAATATERVRAQRDEAQEKAQETEAERAKAVAELERTEEQRRKAETELESARAERDAARALRRAPVKVVSEPEATPRGPAGWRVRAIAAGAVGLPVLILLVLTVFHI